MAPISLHAGCQCVCPGSAWNFELPISRRGLFLQDSFFENAHSQFNNTVKKILQQWGATDVLSDVRANDKLSLDSNLSRYRQLRSHNLREEDQAVTVASDSNSQKIVMDVGDFTCGEVKVRVVGERELVVEGRKEAREGDFSMSSHSFRRRFILPHNTNMAAITSVMSSDGVLTINAPIMVTGCLEIPVQLEGQQSGASNSSCTTTQAAAQSESCSASTEKLGTHNSVVHEHKEHRIPIKINSTLTDSHQHSQAQVNRSATESVAKANQHVEEKTNTGSEGYHVRQAAEFSTRNASVKPKTSTQETGSIPIKRSSFLPITRRGLFFDDSFFEDMRNNFHSAVTDVLNSWGQRGLVSATAGTSVLDTLGRYRQLRSRNLDVESQAITVTADHNSHKIAIDVHEFANEEVKVRVVGERELVVEGRKEAREGDFSVSSHSFRRRFILPYNTNMAAITSVMSSDGVLTINAPYEVPQLKSESVTIPVLVEKSVTSSDKNSSAESEKRKLQEVTEQKTVKNIVEEAGYTVKKVEDSASEQSSNTSKTTAQSQSGSSLTDTGISGCNAATSSSEITNMSSSNKVVQDAMMTPRCISLPVTTRGLFFNDSFFQDAWSDFQEAINDVVSRSSNFCSTADDLSFYRSLRARDMREETQAVKSSEDETNYKIVIDVQDFTTGGNINVKAVNDRELVVEGQVEQQEGGARFKKQFHRRFVLPTNIHLDSVNSVMSSDGVLTITAPKKAPTISIREVSSPLNTIEGVSQSQQQVKASTEASHSNEVRASAARNIAEAINKETAKSSQISSLSTSHMAQAEKTREHIIPVVVEGQIATAKEEKNYHHSVSTQSSHQEQKVSQVTDQSHEGRMRASEDDTCSVCSHATLQSDVSRTREAEVSEAGSTVENDTKVAKDWSQTRMLPISRKGQFFSDTFFTDARQQFTQAVQSVLNKSGATTVLTDDMASYRSLLRKYPDLQNQALHVEEDQRSLKIVLDVHEFVEGDLKVEVVGGKELVVEGEASREEGISSSTLIFRRRFSLPAQAQVAAISCALSSDGVLTVTAPKLEMAAQTAGKQESFSESQTRMESQGPGMQGWREEAVRQATTQGDGFSARSYNSSVASHQQYSSNNTF